MGDFLLLFMSKGVQRPRKEICALFVCMVNFGGKKRGGAQGHDIISVFRSSSQFVDRLVAWVTHCLFYLPLSYNPQLL